MNPPSFASPRAPRDDLTPSLARALVDWYRTTLSETPDRMFRAEELRLPRPPQPVLDYLLAHCGGTCVEFTRNKGAMIRALDVEAEVTVAEAWLAAIQPNAHDPSPATAPKNMPPTPPVTAFAPALVSGRPISQPARPIPPGMCPWTVTPADLIAARLAGVKPKESLYAELQAFSIAAQRTLPKVTSHHLAALDTLKPRFPNFDRVIANLQHGIRLQYLIGETLRFPPQLLIGPPGLGKTAFCRALADALGAELLVQSLAELSGSMIINGNSSQWSGGRAGCLARAIAALPPGKPLMVLFDELDKVAQRGSQPPDRVLLGLLEPSTTKTFRDEYLDLPMDLSPVMFVFTANRLNGVRPELLSRLNQTTVTAPTTADMPAVVRSVDTELRRATPALDRLFEPLDDAVVRHLTTITPREVWHTLESAYARACENAQPGGPRISVAPHNLPLEIVQPPAPRQPSRPPEPHWVAVYPWLGSRTLQ
ncbi:MAG: AAA family ATPase [Nevskiaceae bacterium]|nr:MAG: AAA family ATPase [Nevskiaceae bacterium]TBR75130.1 MAG: AAA family ATPase [Nevskiaceae bacterium]